MLFSCKVVSDSFATPCTVVHQDPLSMGLPRQEYWNRLPFPSPGDLPDPGIEPAPLALPGKFFDSANSSLTTELLRKPPICWQVNKNYKCNIKCQNTIHLSPKLSQISMVNSSPEYVFMWLNFRFLNLSQVFLSINEAVLRAAGIPDLFQICSG